MLESASVRVSVSDRQKQLRRSAADLTLLSDVSNAVACLISTGFGITNQQQTIKLESKLDNVERTQSRLFKSNSVTHVIAS
jgi:Ser-tRNA(Ala) deacylase AlaX